MQILVAHPRIVADKLYGVGVHTLPDELAEHWFVKGLIKCGDFKVLDAVVAPVTIAESALRAPEENLSSQPQKKKGKK